MNERLLTGEPGVTVTFCFVPVQTYLFTRHRLKHGHTPEARFLTSLVTVWLFPISLFWFAWTCDGEYLRVALALTAFH
jgi:hypothetical protein